MTIFVCWPAPGPPWWTIVLPSASRSGRTRSTVAASPPTMIESVAARAPTSPPETGASSAATPRPAAASWISTASDGSLVDATGIASPAC